MKLAMSFIGFMLFAQPSIAHVKHHRSGNHIIYQHHHHKNDYKRSHKHQHTHIRKGITHRHRHFHNGKGHGHHGVGYMHPVPSWIFKLHVH